MFACTMEIGLITGELNVLKFFVHLRLQGVVLNIYCTRHRGTMKFYNPIPQGIIHRLLETIRISNSLLRPAMYHYTRNRGTMKP